jgi:outer membrane protein OmpA-like peptidoglycan-associated protein
MPAALLGCATQQTLDAQAESVNRQLDAQASTVSQQLALLKQAQSGMAEAQKNLEARLGKLESEQALIASRLNHVETASTASAREVDALRAEALTTQSALGALTGKLDSQASDIAKAQETANDAVKIARDSRLVSGKVVDTLLLNESMVSYGYEQPELTARGRAALDQLIAGVRPKLPHVFVEIIGFTDNLSLDSQNRRIALERAESVRRYLHETGGIPLDRMSTISYGDAKPVASTTTFGGQSENRRVLVQVLK